MSIIKLVGNRLLPLLFMSISLLVSGQVSASGNVNDWLSENELQQLFFDKTVTSLNEKHQRISVTYYAADGSVIQEREGKIRTGFWQIKPRKQGARICLAMEGRKMRCRAIVYDGKRYKKYVVKKDGNHRHVVTYREFQTGNRLSRG